jgi:DNA-binding response OmpR family regulator
MSRLKIVLYSCDLGIRSAIRKAFEGDNYEVIEITDGSKFAREGINEQQQQGTISRLTLPDYVDYVVSKAALNSGIEGLAASLALKQKRNDIYPVVIPEAMGFLRDQLERRGQLVLIGGDQAK